MARLEAQFLVEVLAPSLVWVGDPNLVLAVEQGLSVPFTLEIENVGAEAVTYQFTSSWDGGIEFAVTLDDNEYTRTVNPGEVDVLNGHVTAVNVPTGPGNIITIRIE